MADLRPGRDLLPVTTPPFQGVADFDVEIGAHSPIIAKFCDSRKQHFARRCAQSSEMARRPLNQVLADALGKAMKERGLTAQGLGKSAAVAANTVGNYVTWRPDDFTPEGKPKSAKLLEVERIADALKIHPLMLLVDAEDQQECLALASQIIAASVAAASRAAEAPAEVKPRKRQAGRR